jgi:hypothetical protein
MNQQINDLTGWDERMWIVIGLSKFGIGFECKGFHNM